MRVLEGASATAPEKILYHRCTVDLAKGTTAFEDVPCKNLEDALGGFGRSFQFLAERDIADAYAPENPLMVTTGLLTGTDVMTGLRTYFSAYSPLKHSSKGLPSAMWSAASGKFGSKMKWAGLDEIVFEGKSATPVYALITGGEDGPKVELRPADNLLGKNTHQKIMALQKEYADAHFAVIGPAGENHQNVAMAAVALSTENQLKSGDDKCRFAGRGGMGSVMGSKNLIALVAQSKDRFGKLTPGLRDLNREISGGPGSRKLREKNKGGMGGTWTNYDVLDPSRTVPENNFRPLGVGNVEKLFRDKLENEFVIKAESCFRCGINCHKNIYERLDDGKAGAFRAKFDYEPLNLLATNLGIHEGEQAWQLVQQGDLLGMDSISLGVTVAYVLDYNQRHPEKPILNGATFGQFEKIMELIQQTGLGQLPEIGRGVKRLSESLQEPGYGMHVKGLELPAYLPDTNPGFPWAIAGGHMTMYTFMLLATVGDTSIDYWVKAITETGYLPIRDDMIGLCKFSGSNTNMALQGIEEATGLKLTKEEMAGAIRRAFLRGLVLERKQGYGEEDYTLPAQVFEDPNPVLKTPRLITPEFFSELRTKVWGVLEKEMNAL